MKAALLQLLKKNELEQHKFLLAISGGVDSMVLLDQYRQARLHIEVAHVNYGFRGDESDAEMELVNAYCQRHNIPIHILNKKGYADLEVAAEKNLQIWARQVRYDYFNQLKSQFEYDYIVTAHHADDQVETVLMNFSKGTGIKGLRGIKDIQGNILRPLLKYTKDELIQYAASHQIPYLNDSSNASNDYLRNFFRNEIIPQIEARIPGFKSQIMDNVERLKGVEDIYNRYLSQRLPLVLKKDEQIGRYLDIDKLQKEVHYKDLLVHFLDSERIPISFYQELVKLMDAHQGSSIAYGGYTFIKDKRRIYISIGQADDSIIMLDKEQLKVGVKLRIDEVEMEFTLRANHEDMDLHANHFLCLAADALSYPLMMRNTMPGDYFYPFGLNKKKKVAKFLIDEKVPVPKRAKVKVLLSGHHIVAVLPYRIHHRFSVQSSSKEILVIEKL